MIGKYEVLRDKIDMNNRELENYFSPFSRKGFNCIGFYINKRVN